jgi:type VI secretion system ImpA family protein
MVTPEDLLRPISGARPAGDDLRYEGSFDLIREARREDDAGLSQDIWATPLKRADWAEVERLCGDLLAGRTKDLQVAAWLLEAWAHRRGFAGVTEGLRLLAALCEQYWDACHPPATAGDLEARLAVFDWIDDKLSLGLKRLPVTSPQAGETPAYCLADWESARHLENLARRDKSVLEAAEREGRVTRAKFLVSATLSPVEFFRGLGDDARAAFGAAAGLERLLDAKCGRAAPGLRRLRDVLAAAEGLARDMLAERGEELEPAPAEAAEPAERPAEAVEPRRARPRASRIQSRAEAYRILAEAADYLLQTEPHSPTPYLVKRAIAWGRMSLSELLAELIRNPSDLMELYSFLGMRGGETKEGGDEESGPPRS